jgi:tetratricopeptide (TPR) repeat protein
MAQETIENTPAIRLGQRLRQARLARNLTQSEVAASQFSVSYISAVERGQIRPSLGALEKLAQRLQVSVADLLRLEPGETVSSLSGGYAGGAERDDLDSQMREANILIRQGNAEAALDLLISLADRGPSLREQATLKWHLAFCYNALHRAEDARREAQDGILLAERVGDPDLRERLRLELSQAYSLGQKHQAAIDQLRLSMEAIEKAVVLDPLFRLKVLFYLGNESWIMGEHEAAVGYLREAATLADEALDPERLGLLYSQLANVARTQGDYRNGRLFAARCLAAYEDAAHRRVMAQAHTRLGRAYAQSGDLDQALAELQLARERAEQQNDARGLAEAQSNLASLYLRQQRTEDAAKAAEQAITLSESLDDAVQQAEAQVVLAQVLEAKKDYANAERTFELAIEGLRQADAAMQLSDAYAVFSEFLERRGQSRKALEVLKQAWKTRDQALSGH